MPGFLSDYAATTTITFGDEGQWWVKVRQHLRRGDFRAAQTALVRPIMSFTGTDSDTKAETHGDVDHVGYQNELVVRGVVDWNLTDENGVLLPLAPEAARRQSVDALPEEVFEKIVAVLQPARPAKKEDEAAAERRFPDVDQQGAAGQEAGAADPGERAAGEAVLA